MRIFLSIICMLSLPLFAQFKQYESATKFNTSKPSDKVPPAPFPTPATTSRNSIKKLPTTPSPSEIVEEEVEYDEEIGEEKEDELFGRGTGISGIKNAVQDKKYVTLNPETAFGPEVVTSFDFPNVSLTDLTKHMQDLTGINLILDSKELKGKVSIVAPTPITVGDAWKAYLTALHTNGYALVKSGAFYRIVNDREIKTVPTKIYTGNYSPETDNFVMRIIPVKNITVAEVTRTFRNFTTRYGRISEIQQTNTLIIQDTGANVNRLVRLLKFLDVPGHEESLQIIKVKHSSAQEIAKLLDQILKGNNQNKLAARFQGAGQAAQNISKIIAEPRTNSIIAMANADGTKQLNALIEKLDVSNSVSGSEQIHVYYLNYGDAETLSTTLSSLVSGSGGKKGGAPTTPSFLKPEESDLLFSAAVKLTADKANNAIVVTASPTDYLTIKDVIKKLDIPRDQVYVEGLIMETAVDNKNDFGVSVIGALGSGAAQKAGFGNMGDLTNLLTNNITNLSGLFVGGKTGASVDFDTGTGKTIKINTVNGLIKAVASHTSTNVLATPQILALDNTEAVFEVGETVPTPIKDTTSTGTTVSIKDEKVVLNLKITPQINKVTRFIKLKIDQKMDDFSAREYEQGTAKTTRSAITTVIVRDRDTIAMGGLMRDKEVVNISKVPLLGDIPLLGWLFKSRKKEVTKANLLFFLTPKILASYENTAAKTMKDILTRRGAHMKDSFAGGKDPFITTSKGLYQKALMQDKGPLYNVEEAKEYLARNENDSISKARRAEKEKEKEKEKEYKKELQMEQQSAEKPAVSPKVQEEEPVLEEINIESSSVEPDYQSILNEITTEQSKTKK